MICITKSQTADTRTCDFTNVTEETLLASSKQHLGDVRKGFDFFIEKMNESCTHHDHDKISDIAGFHCDFITGFKQTTWWDNHKKVNRHHIAVDDGIRDDVNLIDVMDFIVDCVMAGMGRSGSVYPLALPDTLLQKAFQNTVEMLKNQIKVLDAE